MTDYHSLARLRLTSALCVVSDGGPRQMGVSHWSKSREVRAAQAISAVASGDDLDAVRCAACSRPACVQRLLCSQQDPLELLDDGLRAWYCCASGD